MKDDGTLPLLGWIIDVGGETYRVARMAPEKYGVVRMSDNVRVGMFAYAEGSLNVTAEKVDVSVMAEIAASAIRKGI